ncbi:Low molecular weight protein-tyrosine-phosphatase YwlE [compost metagenome]
MRILFVCTGNTCRSPMAEGMLRKLAQERGVPVEVRSAGVAAMEGIAMSLHAEAVLKDQGIKDNITSTPLKGELISWADLILTLTESHKRQVIFSFPETAEKVYALKEYVEDNESVLADQEELQQLIADVELDRALGNLQNEAKIQRINEIARRLPVYDISDPFGGPREIYDRAAAEIQEALGKLLDKLDGANTDS